MMCVEYTNLYRACLKDFYPLLIIEKLVDKSSKYKLLSFMDTYFGYNQIPMSSPDRMRMTFMTEKTNYQYNVLPFGLNNEGTTYQRMINKVF